MADMFDALGEAIRDRHAGLERVSHTLGIAMVKSVDKSNKWFDVLRAGPSRLFQELKSTEIRVERQTGHIRIILLDIDAQIRCVPEKEVEQRFGSSPELSIPTPRQPPESPLYLVYHQPWGDLRIGLSRSAQPCVESIVTEFKS